jgi:hypothetical protein
VLTVLDFSVPEEELRRRIRRRTEQGTAVSEAGEEVLDAQMAAVEPLERSEVAVCLQITPQSEVERIVASLSPVKK